MSAPQQPGPSFEPPVTHTPGQQWQEPAGLPQSAPTPLPPPSARGPRPLIIVVSALLAVALLLGAGVLIGRELMPGAGSGVSTDARAMAGQLVPPNATEGHGILIGGVAPSPDRPHVIIWQDPQCPACAHYETHFGPVVAELVASGHLTAEARMAYFLDREQPDGASQRAAIALAAADEVGYFDPYHAVLFEQLAAGVQGYTDADLIAFAKLAGIADDDLARFKDLYAARAYADFVANSYAKFTSDEILATPTFLVSGQRLRFYDEASNQDLIHAEPGSFLGAVREAWQAGGRQIEAPPEPR